MVELIPGIRNAVRAVILREDALLVQLKRYDDGSTRHALPGGAPDLGETLQEGLRRECIEEIGVSPEILELMHVADFHKPRETEPPTWRQQVEFLFRCRVPADYVPRNGPKPDKHQIDVLWLPLADLHESFLFPPALRAILSPAPGPLPLPLYLGLIK